MAPMFTMGLRWSLSRVWSVIVDGVKGFSRGLHPHPGADILLPVVHQGQQQQDGLDHTLDGKALLEIPGDR